MRVFLVAVILLIAGSALAQTLMGNCFGGFVGTDTVSGNVYCTPPSTCSGVIDASAGCPLPMLGM